MKKLFIILLVALSYSLSFAEDYTPDEKGMNWDEQTVTLTTTCIDPLQAAWVIEPGASQINDVIDGTKRTFDWANGQGLVGKVVIDGAEGHDYEMTFESTFTHEDGLVIKGVWTIADELVTSPAPGTGDMELSFLVTEVDATSDATTLDPGWYYFTIPVTIEYTDL